MGRPSSSPENTGSTFAIARPSNRDRSVADSIQVPVTSAGCRSPAASIGVARPGRAFTNKLKAGDPRRSHWARVKRLSPRRGAGSNSRRRE